MLTLTLYDGNEGEILPLIAGFWLAHNGERQTAEESRVDLQAWTGPDHRLYAIRLYRRLDCDCLNTVTLRRDFPGYDYEVVRTESLYGAPFEIRRSRN